MWCHFHDYVYNIFSNDSVRIAYNKIVGLIHTIKGAPMELCHSLGYFLPISVLHLYCLWLPRNVLHSVSHPIRLSPDNFSNDKFNIRKFNIYTLRDAKLRINLMLQALENPDAVVVIYIASIFCRLNCQKR